MALQTQLVDVVFKEGADTKTSSDQVLASQLNKALNVRMDKIGAVIPRPGFQPFATYSASSNFAGEAFEAVADEASIVTGSKGILWSTNSESVLALGTIPRGGLARSYYGEVADAKMHIAASSTQVFMAWIDTAQGGTPRLGISLSDAASGRVIYQNVITVGATDGVQVAYTTTAGFIVFLTNPHNLRALQFDLAQADSSFPFNPLSWPSSPAASTFMRFAVAQSGTTKIYLAYSIDSSNSVLYQVLTYSSGTLTVALGTTAFTLTGAAKCVSITTLLTGLAEFAIGAANDGGALKTAFYSNTGSPVGTTNTNALTATAKVERIQFSAAKNNTVKINIWGVDTASGNGKSYKFSFDSTGVLSTGTPYVTGLAPITGSIFVDSQDNYIADSYTAPTYGSQGFLGDTNYTPTLTSLGVSMNLGNSLSGELPQAPNPVQVGNLIYYCLPVITSVTALAANTPSGAIQETIAATFKKQATVLTWDLSFRGTSLIEKNNGQRIYIGTSTACLAAPAVSPGFWPEPLIKTADASVIAGGIEAAGTVSFVIAKKFVSPDGAEYRTYSEIFTVSIAVNSQLQVAVSQWDFNSLSSQVLALQATMELYRTERGGQIFYLAGSRVTAGNLTDTLTDMQLVKQRTADINGNELPSTLIPSARLVTKFSDRLVLVPADFPNKVYFEKPGAQPQGTVFAGGLEIELNDEGGNITGLLQMDSALYVFKRNQVLTVYGEPAGATGEGSTLTVPHILANGIGCIDPRSVVLTKNGIIFKSEKGFYLIARNQQISFVGEGPYVDRTVQVTGSGVSSDQPEVYFAHSNGDIWVLNLDNGGWYWWYCAQSIGGLATSNNLTYLACDTEVLKIDPTLLSDVIGTVPLPIVQDVVTGWIKTNHLRGYQRLKRLYILGTALASANVTVEIFTDYSETAVQSLTFAVVAGPMQIDLHLQVQKCEALKFRVKSNKYAMSLSGATLTIGTKTGPDKSRTSSSNY